MTNAGRENRLLKRSLHLRIAAGLCRVHRRGDSAEVPPRHAPRRIAKHTDGDLSPLQILLVADLLVSREQNLEPVRLGSREQFPIGNPIPAETLSPR